MSLAEFLKKHRTEAKLSIRQAAEAVGVDKNVIQKWETGAYAPKPDKWSSIASAYGLTADEKMEMSTIMGVCF